MRSVRLNHRSRRCAALLPAFALAAAAQAQAGSWGGSLALTSDYAFRGLTQSDNHPSVQGDAHYYGDAGWFAGLWAASVKRSPYASTSAELNAYAGYARPLSADFSAKLGYIHYAYLGNAPRDQYDYDEVSGTLAWRGRLFASVAVSPDASAESTRGTAKSRTAVAYELALHQPLPRAFSFNGGVGYDDLGALVHAGYVYWNAGLAYDFGRAQLDLSYIGTDHRARELFYDSRTVNRWVGTLIWRF